LKGTHQDWKFLDFVKLFTVQVPPISGYMPDQLGTTGQLGATGWQGIGDTKLTKLPMFLQLFPEF